MAYFYQIVRTNDGVIVRGGLTTSKEITILAFDGAPINGTNAYELNILDDGNDSPTQVLGFRLAAMATKR